MDLTLSIIALVLGIIGLVGVFVTGLPGTVFSYAGLVCVYFNSDTTISTAQLIVCGILLIVVLVLDYVLPGYSARYLAEQNMVFGALQSEPSWDSSTASMA